MATGSASNMSQDLARQLFDEGAAFIFLNVPLQTEIGIDLTSWNVGPKFKGIKMIPPGIHFIYYSAVSKEGQSAPRTGFFHSFKKKELLVKKWDKYAEDVSEEEISEEEIDTLHRNLRGLDKFLGPYPYDDWKKWISLSSYITDDVLERMQPLNGKISSVSQLILDESDIKEEPRSRKKNIEDDLLPKLIHKPGTGIRFTKLPEQTYPEGCSAAEITRHSLDLSFRFQQLIEVYSEPEDVLGDLQMAFVCFLVGQVFDAFEQWKHLVHLLCSCDAALEEHSELFSKLIFILYHQIQEIPRDFFVDIVSSSNFLTTTLHTFFMNLQTNQNIDCELVAKGKRFQKYLTKKFRWDFQNEPDEYAPVVVDISNTNVAN